MTSSKSRAILLLLTLPLLSACTSTTTEKGSENDQTNVQQTAVDRPVEWGYQGGDGPSTWATLDPVYALCGEGKEQSPIDLVSTSENGETKWSFDYKTTSLRIAHTEHMTDLIDNGHTIQITVDEGSTFTFGDKTYSLKQFHFHTPSEHTIDGIHMPMEMHMVHQSDDESLAVISVLFKEGTQVNENFATIIANLPDSKGESKHITDTQLELNVHIPEDIHAYHYKGSLTTPPCSENVQWMVLRNMVELTPEEIEAFSSRIGPNNRPVQNINERLIEISDLASR
jgi:carbonic anhydrase